jgi:hypothetical protein
MSVAVTRRSTAALVVVALLAATRPALADPDGPATSVGPDVEEGKREFATGSDRMRDGAYEEALTAFVASNRALPSPNTTLLIARCLRALGRVEEAADRFQAAAVDAEARVAAGESRYQQAASTARAEGASLRATLGVLHLRLIGAAGTLSVDVDERRSPIRADGTVDVLHRPGEVRYRIRDGESTRAEGRATVAAGRWTSVDVVVPAKDSGPLSPAAPIAPSTPPSWLVPGAVTAGFVGVLGLGSFTFFGLRSQSTFDDLRDRCAPRCGQEDRDAASRGDTEQTIANVSLAIGAIALSAGITLGIIALSHRSPAARAHALPWAGAWAPLSPHRSLP